MTALQERLQLNRLQMPLEKWNTREQLCLASAVSSSGDQNWMSVSRSVKVLCGTDANRPADFFSQKSCAVQYGAMLENVETPKRKKRESISGQASPVETPTDVILRRLTEERIQEIRVDIQKDQEEYAKVSSEVRRLQSGDLSDEHVLEMWHEIEKQQELQRIEEMKLENQLREREQRRQELQRSWRHGHPGGAPSTPPTVVLQKPLSIEAGEVDMDVEEVIDVKPPILANITITGGVNQQQTTGQTATSPLLSSLLKSPTTTTAPTTLAPVVVSSNSARACAPTITTLLTSGAIPNPNQPAIVLKKLPPEEAAQVLSRPISGPPTESLILPPANAQNLLSPSQSAPTLSMLLEKNKGQLNVVQSSPLVNAIIEETKTEDGKLKQEAVVLHTTDFNNEEVPMDIEEDVNTSSIAPKSNDGDTTIIGGADSDDTDPNEEQQLLEVFKNIGNIEELGIDVADVIDDEEVDFLKGVDEEPPPHETASEIMDLENKLEAESIPSVSQKHLKNVVSVEVESIDDKSENESKPVQEETIPETHITSETESTPLAKEEVVQPETPVAAKVIKIETSSSDDSNDNIPLAAVASLENKERNQPTESVPEKPFLKENFEAVIKNDHSGEKELNELAATSNDTIKNEDVENTTEVISETEIAPETNTEDEEKVLLNMEEKSPADSESCDIIVIQTDDESSSEKQPQPLNSEDVEETIVSKEVVTEKEESIQNEDVKELDEDDEDANSNVTEETNNALLKEKSTSLLSASQTQETPIADAKTNNVSQQASISIADTDDSSTTDISVTTTSTIKREDKPSGANTFAASRLTLSQHQSRKSQQESVSRNEHKAEEESTTSSTAPARPPMLRKLRDRDRSESPMIDDDNTTASDNYATSQRSRRRCSSTPVIDSIPSSPASSDRDEARSSKKLLFSIFNGLQYSKNATAIQRAINEDQSKYDEICLRPIDLQTIKKNIESGTTRNVNELQRDIMLMCQNAIMVFRSNTTGHKAAIAFLQESQGIREFISHPSASDGSVKSEKELKDGKSSSSGGGSSLNVSGVKGRAASRKSQRIS